MQNISSGILPQIHVEIEQSNTMQTMQTQKLQQVCNQSGLDLEILYIFHISFHIFHIVNVLGLDWRRPRYLVGVESFWIVRQLLTNSGL